MDQEKHEGQTGRRLGRSLPRLVAPLGGQGVRLAPSAPTVLGAYGLDAVAEIGASWLG